MIKPEVLDMMLSTGCTAEQIVAAVKADAQAELARMALESEERNARKAHQREVNAARQRRQRERNAESRVTERDDALVTRDNLSPKKENPQTPKEKTPPILERETRDRQFDQIWAIYPRKTGKAPARKAFDAALKLADFPTILAGAERYAAERAGQDNQYTKHATTWFHGQHWQDEAEPPKPPPRPSRSPPETVGSLSRKQLFTPRTETDVTDYSERRVEAGGPRRLEASAGPSGPFTVTGDILGSF